MAQQRKRNPNGAGTITKRKDGRYQCAVYVLQPDGTRARKFAYGKTWQECDTKRRELLAKVDQGVPVPTRSAKLSEWLPYWLENIIKPRRKLSTYDKYEAHVRLYLVPLLGAKRLESLAVADVRRFLVRLEKATTAATAKESHGVLRSALSSACLEELIARNVAKLVEPPRTDNRELRPWTRPWTSSRLPVRTRCTRPSCSPSPWACAAGRSSVSGGRTSTWTTGCSTSATRRSGAVASCTTTIPRAVAAAPSRCPRSASRPCAGTGYGRRQLARRRARTGRSRATCSPPAPVARSSRGTSIGPSPGSPSPPASALSGCTTPGTAPPPSPRRPGSRPAS